MNDANDTSAVGRVRAAIADHDVLKVLLLLLGIWLLFTILAWNQNPGQRLNAIAGTLRFVTFLGIVYALLALALNLHWGYTGMFNIGVAGFMAVGVYVYTIVVRTPDPAIAGEPAGLGLPIVVGIVAGMLAAALVGLVAALPALRLRADYFAIVTLGLSEIIRLTLQSSAFDGWLQANLGVGTGSGAGVSVSPGPDDPVRDLFYVGGSRAEGTTPLGDAVFAVTDPIGIQQTVMINWAYVVVLAAVAVGFYWFLSRLGRSPFGRVLKAIREDELVANSLGKNVNVAKIKVFMIGCALMGLGGILWQGSQSAVSPTPQFLPVITFYIFVAMMIGGAGSNTGSVLGGLLFAGVLFEGPRAVGRLIGGQFDVAQNPRNFADAVSPLLSGDFAPLLVYMTEVRIAALQFVLLGVVLVILMQRRPEGMLGHRIEEAAAVDLAERPNRADPSTAVTDGGDDDE